MGLSRPEWAPSPVPRLSTILLTCALVPWGATPRATVRHYLPFPAGTTYNIWQGNEQGPSHNDQWNRYAFDFSPMAEGSSVCASADGVVVYVKEDTAGPTDNIKDNNEIAVLHEDNTVSTYLHLQKDGALVNVGQRVHAGDVIGLSGNTGKSSGAHLHFGLRQDNRLGKSVPCHFADVEGDGVPKTNMSVKSGNLSAAPLHALFDQLEADYSLASKLDAREWIVARLNVLLNAKPSAEVDALMKVLGGGANVKSVYDMRRDAILKKYKDDAASALASIETARASGELSLAFERATLALADFPKLDVASKIQTHIQELRKDPASEKAQKNVANVLVWRRNLRAALDSELKNRKSAAEGKKVLYGTLRATMEDLVKRAPTEEQKKALEEHLKTLPSK